MASRVEISKLFIVFVITNRLPLSRHGMASSFLAFHRLGEQVKVKTIVKYKKTHKFPNVLIHSTR